MHTIDIYIEKSGSFKTMKQMKKKSKVKQVKWKQDTHQ